MLATSYNATDVLLVTERPNWATAPEATFEVLREDTAGLSNREARRPWSGTLRTSLTYTALVRDADARALLGSVRSLAEQPVAMPFWPGEVLWADRATAPITGGLKLAFKADWSDWEIYEDTEPTWPAADDRWVPLLWGFLEPQTETRWIHGALGETEFRFTEDSPANWALSPREGSTTAGPLPPTGHTTAPDLLDYEPQQAGAHTHTVRVRIERTPAGRGRQRGTTFYSQAATALSTRGYLLTSAADIGAFLCFWACRAGGDSFWARSGVIVAVLSAAALTSDTVLNVEDTTALVVGDYVAFGDVLRRVTALTDDTLTVDAAVGTALAAGTAGEALLLVAFDSAKLTLEWIHGGLATVKPKLREVAAEYAPAAGETLGTTLGRLAERAHLYEFTRDYGNGTTVVTRWTSHEQDVVWNGHTWSAQPGLSHGERRQSLNLEREGVELTTFFAAGNPLVDDVTLASEGTLTCVIREVDLLAADCCTGAGGEDDDQSDGDVRVDNPDLFDLETVPLKVAGLPAPVLSHQVIAPDGVSLATVGPDNGATVVIQLTPGPGEFQDCGWDMASTAPVTLGSETYTFSALVAGDLQRIPDPLATGHPRVWTLPASVSSGLVSYAVGGVSALVHIVYAVWIRDSDSQECRSAAQVATYVPPDAP